MSLVLRERNRVPRPHAGWKFVISIEGCETRELIGTPSSIGHLKKDAIGTINVMVMPLLDFAKGYRKWSGTVRLYRGLDGCPMEWRCNDVRDLHQRALWLRNVNDLIAD